MGTEREPSFWQRLWYKITTPWHYVERAHNRVMIMLRYIPIAWKDYDWDWANILRVLQFKIRRTRICIQEQDITTRTEQMCAEMKDIEDNIQRVLDDDYMMDRIGEYLRKYPLNFKKSKTYPGMSEMESPTPTPEDEAQYKSDSSMREMMAINDWKALWAKIERYMQGWWD